MTSTLPRPTKIVNGTNAAAPVPNTLGDFEALIERSVERVLERKLAELRTAGADAPGEWLSTAEAAHHVRCSKRHLLEVVKRGDLQAVRFGRMLRFKRSDVDEYLSSNGAVQS